MIKKFKFFFFFFKFKKKIKTALFFIKLWRTSKYSIECAIENFWLLVLVLIYFIIAMDNIFTRFLHAPVPNWVPFIGDGEALPMYLYIRMLFSLATFCFYHGVYAPDVEENAPPVGTPTLLCFNHSNGLTDATVLMRTFPRMIRFCAKDTLWRDPGIKTVMIKASGAVPVKRKQEHGDNADNTSAMSAVSKALMSGQVVSIAPEGTSRMRTVLEHLKSGVGRMAVDAVVTALANGLKDFKVHVVPCGIVYLHREKWRSNVLCSYCKNIIVDASFLARFGVTESTTDPRDPKRFEAVRAIMTELRSELESNMLIAPHWQALRDGVAAGRIFRSEGAKLPLGDWIGITRHFATTLCSEAPELTGRLRAYQEGLDALGIRDARIMQMQKRRSQQKPALIFLIMKILVRLAMFLGYATIALPGAIFWLPTWIACKRAERKIIRRARKAARDGAGKLLDERYDFDTISETKMAVSFIMLNVTWFAAFVACSTFLCSSMRQAILVSCVILPCLMWFTVRQVEEAFSSARSLISNVRLALANRKSIRALIEVRRGLEKDILAFAKKTGAPEPKLRSTKGRPRDGLWSDSPFWNFIRYFSPLYRRKRDWTEVLRFSDDLTYLDFYESEAASPQR